MSRGLRNNNPGNIRRSKVRYRGECATSSDAEFKQFQSPSWGYRAMFVLLHTYACRMGLNTVSGMIARYAPSSENDTEAYVRSVARLSGVEVDAPVDTLDESVMIPVVSAMSRVENGTSAVQADVRSGWILFRQDFK